MPTPRKPLSVSLTPPTIPYRSSKLSLPPSPFSPQWPITPHASSRPSLSASSSSSSSSPPFPPSSTISSAPPAPPKPLNWLWQCHLCHKIYNLAVTRRCLDDGHFFCAGVSSVRRCRYTGRVSSRRVHRACASEFDYRGWRVWGVWRRGLEVVSSRKGVERGGGRGVRGKDCWARCDYPSECRWGRKFGASKEGGLGEEEEEGEAPRGKETFEEILLGIEKGEGSQGEEQVEEVDLGDSVRAVSVLDLVVSAKRRKRKSDGCLPSPLVEEVEELAEDDEEKEEGEEGEDVVNMSRALHQAF